MGKGYASDRQRQAIARYAEDDGLVELVGNSKPEPSLCDEILRRRRQQRLLHFLAPRSRNPKRSDNSSSSYSERAWLDKRPRRRRPAKTRFRALPPAAPAQNRCKKRCVKSGATGVESVDLHLTRSRSAREHRHDLACRRLREGHDLQLLRFQGRAVSRRGREASAQAAAAAAAPAATPARQRLRALLAAFCNWAGAHDAIAESQFGLAALASLCAGERGGAVQILRRLARRVGPTLGALPWRMMGRPTAEQRHWRPDTRPRFRALSRRQRHRTPAASPL
jgi:hypothetical protein